MADWHDDLPAELRDSPSLKDVKDVPTLAKSYIDAQSYVGSSIRVPGETASPEQVKEFHEKLKARVPTLVDTSNEAALWEKLGKPNKPEEYTPPEDVKLPEPDVQNLRAMANALGLTKKQAAELFKARVNETLAAETKFKEMQAEVKREWGQKYEDNVSKVVAVAEKLGAPPALLQAAKEGKLDKATMTYLYNQAQAIGTGETRQMVSDKTAGDGRMTPAEAEAQIQEVMSNKAFKDPRDPLHKHLQQKLVKLVEAAGAGKSREGFEVVRNT